MKKLIYILILSLILITALMAEENVYEKADAGLSKSTVTSDLWVDVNRMNGVFRNNGTWFYDNILGDWGLEWPKGSGLSPIFGAGQFLGANVGGTVKVAASYHNHTEFQAGQIIDGVATNPLNPEYRWYVIRPNGVGDWDTWPYDQGAPNLKTVSGEDSLDATGNKIPKLIGDITAYCVINDYAEHSEFATPKLGAEIGMTIWAFNRADAIGDMVFIKWTLINKSTDNWDETYFAIWSDPDVGDGWDDFVGCDTTLGIGYCYNANDNDQNYGVAPPAVGIDFFQGPIVDSPGEEVVLPDGTVIPDKRMLKMTSFIFYNNDDSNQGNPQTGGDVWNYLRGMWRDGNPITFGGTGTDPNGTPAPFMFSGNPETGDGWLDTDESDRRFMMTTGAYSNEPWSDSDGDGIAEFGEPGVQEIVAGALVGKGSNNLNSVTFLKAIDEIAQLAYDIDFALPPSPAQPEITISESENVVTLTWTNKSEFENDGVTPYSVPDIVANGLIGQLIVVGNEYKEVTDGTYDFTGYSVYQYRDASGSEPVMYQRFGPETISATTPYTGSHFIRLETNKHPGVGNVGDRLVNGQDYYFGIVANSYCEFAIPVDFTSAPTIVTITPQYLPGERLSCAFNDTVETAHVYLDANGPQGDGSVIAWVVDPAKVTGEDYKVDFNADGSWNLKNVSASTTLLENQTKLTGDDSYDIIDGLMLKVIGPPPGINPTRYGDAYGEGSATSLNYLGGWDFDGDRWIGGRDKEWIGLFGGLGNGEDHLGTSLVQGTDYMDVELNFASLTEKGEDDVTVEAIMALSKAQDPTRWSKAAAIDGWGTWGASLGDIPIAAYDMESNPPRRLKLAFIEDSGTPANNLIWDMGWNPVDSTFVDDGAYEYIYILNEDYDEEYTNYLPGGSLDGEIFGGWPILYTISPQARGSRAYLLDPFDMQIFASNVLTSNDEFTFTSYASAEATETTLKEDIKKINVVPNPYYGYHKNESNIFARWVQFNNIPANKKVTIKIFDLAGNKIRTIEKPVDSSTLVQYDLKNEYQLPIASGIYIYHVDVAGIGEKVGKMAVFAPNERLDTY